MEKRERRSVGFVGPMILIILGTVFLLNTMGIIQMSVWELIFRFWPILLIAAGLDILIGRRSTLGALVALVLTLAILAGALWVYQTGATLGLRAAGQPFAHPLGNATQATVIVDLAATSLHVEAAEDSPNLVEGTTSEGMVTPEATTSDGKTTVTLQGGGGSSGPFPADQAVWELRLSDDIPLTLDISNGVGQSEIDLTGLTVTEFNVGMGVGQTKVILPAQGIFDARIEGAIGELVVIIPKGLAARVEMDTGLVARQLPSSYRCQEDVCTSPDYSAGADHKANLQIDLAIGSVAVREASGQ